LSLRNADVLAQAQSLVKQLGALLRPYATPLTPDERHTLTKMGDKTFAFVEKAHDLSKINPARHPLFLDKKVSRSTSPTPPASPPRP
jgi:hypothetical protein